MAKKERRNTKRKRENGEKDIELILRQTMKAIGFTILEGCP